MRVRSLWRGFIIEREVCFLVRVRSRCTMRRFISKRMDWMYLTMHHRMRLGYCLLVGMVVLRWRIARINLPRRCHRRLGVRKKVVSEWIEGGLGKLGGYLKFGIGVEQLGIQQWGNEPLEGINLAIAPFESILYVILLFNCHLPFAGTKFFMLSTVQITAPSRFRQSF
jgi:hypothetical protein